MYSSFYIHRFDVVVSNQLYHFGDKLFQLRLGDDSVAKSVMIYECCSIFKHEFEN